MLTASLTDHFQLYKDSNLILTTKLFFKFFCNANGIRTRISTLRGWRPKPLVDGIILWERWESNPLRRKPLVLQTSPTLQRWRSPLFVGMARLELATPEGSGFTDQRDYLCHIIPILYYGRGSNPHTSFDVQIESLVAYSGLHTVAFL